MMKTKIKNQKQEEQEELEVSEIQSDEQQQPVQQPSSQPQPESQPPALLLQHNNNKRKALEEGLSTDRTRPRYNGIPTMV